MPSSEHRALILLLSLALLGQGVRWWFTRPGDAPGEVQLLATLPPRSPAAHRDSALALSRPLAAGERIDADRATAQELSRLPRIGLALAKSIVADRDAKGPFGALAALDRVPGLGPKLLGAIGAHLTFSGTPVAGPSGPPSSPGAGGLVNLNTASPFELDALPGIGPARARAIVEFRERHGFFSAVDQLRRVPGLGPAAVTQLRERVTLR